MNAVERILAQLPAINAVEEQEPVEFFRLWPTAELLDAPRSFAWLARGLWVQPSYGMIGGERKTLKSHLTAMINVGVAAGVPILGHFAVEQPRPVVHYVGEGGRIPHTRRLERVAASMGVRLRDVELYSSFDVAPIDSPRFAASLARDLAERRPGLVSLDPLYAFHGAKTNASNLFEEGALLTSVSRPCVDAGASLQIVTHFNKTGSGRDLGRLTQAGGAEWSDSWVLVSHRTPPDIAAGSFHLVVDVGSRQWGGSTWVVDLELGRFDVDQGDFVGDISWTLERHEGNGDRDVEREILKVVSEEPWQHTKTGLRKLVGGNHEQFNLALDRLESNEQIVSVTLPRPENGREVKREVWGAAGSSPPPRGRPAQQG